MMIDIGFSLIKRRYQGVANWSMEGRPLLSRTACFLRHRMHEARIQEDDIMEAARIGQGFERVNQIKYAVLERNGKISIIPS